MGYEIHEVDGLLNRDAIERLNGLAPDVFPPLTLEHLTKGHWWLAYHSSGIAAFAGMVEMSPFPNVGYFKRCFVMPGHQGHGLQYRLMKARELKARQLGWTTLVSECLSGNLHSAANFRRAGFTQTFPEQPWARDSIYWIKKL